MIFGGGGGVPDLPSRLKTELPDDLKMYVWNNGKTLTTYTLTAMEHRRAGNPMPVCHVQVYMYTGMRDWSWVSDND